MITGIDHAVIAVDDLGTSVRHFEDMLGFTVSLGGRHTGLGSHNAIVRFASDYLELIALYDVDEARAGFGGRGTGLIDALELGQGLLAFAVRTDDIYEDVRRLQAHGVPVCEPLHGQRRRPDDVVIRWRYAFVDRPLVRSRLPFFIEWETPPETRLGLEPLPNHENGAEGIAKLSLVVRDVSATADLYRRGLGLPVTETCDDAAVVELGSATIDVRGPATSDSAAAILDQWGEGLCRVTVRVSDADKAREVMQARGVEVHDAPTRSPEVRSSAGAGWADDIAFVA